MSAASVHSLSVSASLSPPRLSVFERALRSSSIGHRPAGARSLSLLIPCRVSASALQVKVSSSIPHPLSLSLPLPLPLLHTPISATHRSSYTTPTTPTNSTPNTPHLPHTPLTPMGRRKIEIQPITVRPNTHHHSRPNPIFNPTPDRYIQLAYALFLAIHSTNAIALSLF